MVTKSKNKGSQWFSIIAITIALLSFMYCFSFIQQLVEQGFFHSNRTVVHLARIIKGGV